MSALIVCIPFITQFMEQGDKLSIPVIKKGGV